MFGIRFVGLRSFLANPTYALGQLAQRERGWGESSKQLKNWNFGSSIISLTPTPTLPRCGLRPAGEGGIAPADSKQVLTYTIAGIVYVNGERLQL